MGWKINGVPHTGQIITVGPSGRDFTNVFVALNAIYADAQMTDELVLVDPGTYVCPNNCWAGLIAGKRVCIRGLGDTASQTMLYKNYSNGQMLYVFGGGTAIIENCTLRNDYEWRHALSIGQDATIVINKCSLIAGTWSYTISSMDNTFVGSLQVRYSELRKGYRHVAGYGSSYKLNLARISLFRTTLDSAFSSIYTEGNLALADYVATPTEGYGYSYGDFLITEGGGAIAPIEQHYRRLRNG